MATKSPVNVMKAHADMVAANEAIRDAANVTTIASGTLHRFSPMTADIENSLSHGSRGEDWAKNLQFVAVPVSTASKQDVKQADRYDAIRGFVNSSGKTVLEIPYGIADLLGTNTATRNFVVGHMLAHAKALAKAINGIKGADTSKMTDKAKAKAVAFAKNGRHNADFKAFATDYFTEFEKSQRKVSDNRPLKMSPAFKAKMEQFIWNEKAWTSLAPVEPKQGDTEGKTQTKWVKVACPTHDKVVAKLPEGANYSITCPKKVKKVTCGKKMVKPAKKAKASK